MNTPAYLISSTTGVATIYFNGKVHTVAPDHVNYSAIVDALRNKVYDTLETLVDVAKTITAKAEAVKVEGKPTITVKDGQVLYGDEVCHNAVVNSILDFARKGLDFKPLVLFLSNVMENPSKKSLDNLWRFMEVNQHPVTEDGCFLTYKRVNTDYTDIHSRKFVNTVGTTVEMPRNAVEDDPNVTCAAGLHVASLRYARDEYASGQGRLVVCKVNPKDVVSVPTDYNSAKMRVCKYEVVQDYTHELKQEDVTPVEMDEDTCFFCGEYYDDCTCDDDDYEYCQDCGVNLEGCDC